MVTPDANLMFGDTIGRIEVPEESFIDNFLQDFAHSAYKR